METRKKFLQKCTAVLAAITIPGFLSRCSKVSDEPFKTQEPKKGVVLWYSQSGNTRRYARLIGKTWEKLGLEVDAMEYRDIKPASLKKYDIIMIGTPVHNYDTPVNVKRWLEKIPDITGTAVFSFVSFGGPEGNQHNAASTLLELMADKKGIPAGMSYFMNMSSFPVPEWDAPGQLEHRHLPDGNTYNSVRSFAKKCIDDLKQGKRMEVDRHIALREFFSILPLAWLTKLFIGKHEIDREKCINCGTCEKVCPSGSISPSFTEVKRDDCLLCFGCFNNCPEQAVIMTLGGKSIYNFPEFLKRNKIVIKEPGGLAG